MAPPRNPPPLAEQPNLQDLYDSIIALTAAFTQFRETQNDRHNHYLASFDNLNSQIPTSSSNNQSSTPKSNDNSLKPPKVRLLLFDGSNPLDWVFQA
ncbi:hypothetical protein A2U01_0059839, partial [Trifolium medium]|nr:hypothetical protein [Trifolium medium]